VGKVEALIRKARRKQPEALQWPGAVNAGGSAQCGYETFKQRDEPLSGRSDSGDNGERNKPGDEAVFDGGSTGLIAQKLPKHLILSRALNVL
jgi:hypothetical protein